MSKAFTKESDDEAPERGGRSRQASGLPPGALNYLTEDGARRFRNELDRLVLEERPRVKEAPERLREVNQRIAEVQQVLRSATVVAVPSEGLTEVRFGTSVTVRSADGEVAEYRIVGVDETDAERGWVSWLSPIAKALLGGRIGQAVRLVSAAGESEMEIVAISH